MHFSRSLAGVALLGVFAAMAFAGAATGAPAQSEERRGGSHFGHEAQFRTLGVGRMSRSASKALREESLQGRASRLPPRRSSGLPAAQAASRKFRRRPAALSYKAPKGLNATAAAAAISRSPASTRAVLSTTGVNAFQQETFGGFNLEPPDPSLCAGQGFVIQVVNSQVQISNGNLQKLTAPIPMEAFFGDFVNSLFDPLCAFNHSTGRWYMTDAVSDFATFSGVYIAVSTAPTRAARGTSTSSTWPSSAVTVAAQLGLCLADQPNLGCRPVHDLDLDEPVRPAPGCGVRYVASAVPHTS